MTTNHKIIIGLGAAYAAFLLCRYKGIFGVSGIGAAKRRIFKEISLA